MRVSAAEPPTYTKKQMKIVTTMLMGMESQRISGFYPARWVEY